MQFLFGRNILQSGKLTTLGGEVEESRGERITSSSHTSANREPSAKTNPKECRMWTWNFGIDGFLLFASGENVGRNSHYSRHFMKELIYSLHGWHFNFGLLALIVVETSKIRCTMAPKHMIGDYSGQCGGGSPSYSAYKAGHNGKYHRLLNQMHQARSSKAPFEHLCTARVVVFLPHVCMMSTCCPALRA